MVHTTRTVASMLANTSLAHQLLASYRHSVPTGHKALCYAEFKSCLHSSYVLLHRRLQCHK
jgi:hypothetical protein